MGRKGPMAKTKMAIKPVKQRDNLGTCNFSLVVGECILSNSLPSHRLVKLSQESPPVMILPTGKHVEI